MVYISLSSLNNSTYVHLLFSYLSYFIRRTGGFQSVQVFMSKCYHFDKAPQGGKTDKSAASNVLMPCIPGTDSTLVYQGEME